MDKALVLLKFFSTNKAEKTSTFSKSHSSSQTSLEELQVLIFYSHHPIAPGISDCLPALL